MKPADTCAIVVLISGSGSNLQAIIDATARGAIPGHIAAVISNEPAAYGLQRAQAAGIETRVVDHRRFDSREAFDRALLAVIGSYQPAVVTLAGFMRILTDIMITPLAGRMLNIHPSLLPRYRGLHTHRRVLESGDHAHGCSVHFATAELDGGPVILQAEVPVVDGDTEQSLASRVLDREHIIYPLVVRWFCQGRLGMEGNTAILDGERLGRPLRLDEVPPEEIAVITGRQGSPE